MIRATVLAVFIFTALGVIAMDATAQKKEKQSPYVEAVTLRVWDKKSQQFGPAKEGIGAYRKDVKGGVRFYLDVKPAMVSTARPTVGSEITDEAGNVYTVDKLGSLHPPYPCHVSLKMAAKKPD